MLYPSPSEPLLPDSQNAGRQLGYRSSFGNLSSLCQYTKDSLAASPLDTRNPLLHFSQCSPNRDQAVERPQRAPIPFLLGPPAFGTPPNCIASITKIPLPLLPKTFTSSPIFFDNSRFYRLCLPILSLAAFTLGLTVIVATFSPAFAQDSRIAILAPASKTLTALRDQLVAGAEIASEDAAHVHLTIISDDFTNPGIVSDTYRRLSRENVSLAIGGLVPDSSTTILLQAAKSSVPTILLSPPKVRPPFDSVGQVLQFGLPDPFVYQLGLKHWLRKTNIDEAWVLYTGKNRKSFTIGAHLTPEILSRSSDHPRLSTRLVDLSQYGENSSLYMDFVFDKLSDAYEKHNIATGVVLANVLDPDSLYEGISSLSMTKSDDTLSLFYAYPDFAADLIAKASKHASKPVYGVAQFWLNSDIPKQKEFLDRVEGKKGFFSRLTSDSLSQSFESPIMAAKSYDAVLLGLETLERHGPGPDLWLKRWQSQQSQDLKGISGPLRFLNQQVVTGPISLVRALPRTEGRIEVTPLDPISSR